MALLAVGIIALASFQLLSGSALRRLEDHPARSGPAGPTGPPGAPGVTVTVTLSTLPATTTTVTAAPLGSQPASSPKSAPVVTPGPVTSAPLRQTTTTSSSSTTTTQPSSPCITVPIVGRCLPVATQGVRQ